VKTVVLITGTNAVGKSSLAKAIMERMGGVDRTDGDVTYTRYGGVAFAGRYDTRYGGVDRITNEKGSSCTSSLAGVVEEALRGANTVFCEGMYLNTFGLNLSNALFKGERALVVSLWADPTVIYERVCARSNGKYGSGKRSWKTIIQKQRQAMVAARKWQSIGVPVLQVNTGEVGPDGLADIVLKKIDAICGR